MALDKNDIDVIRQLLREEIDSRIEPLRTELSELKLETEKKFNKVELGIQTFRSAWRTNTELFQTEMREFRAELADFKAETASNFSKVRTDIEAVRTESKRDLENFRSEVAEFRSETMASFDELFKRDGDREQEYLSIRHQVAELEKKVA